MDSSRNGILVVSCILVVMLVGFASSDVAKDRAECADKLVGLATCLPYVGGDAKAPTLDCCTGLKQVLDKSKKCLCVLIRDRNDPSLGLKINATLALSLPTECHSPANISNCPALLGLAPNSPDAKIFETVSNSTQSNSTLVTDAKGNSSSNGSSASIKSDGGKGKKWLGVEIVCGILLWCFSSHIIFNA